MTSFSKTLQKFLVYFFSGVSVLVVVLGIQRVKQGDPLGVAPASDNKGGTGNTGTSAGLASSVQGQTVTATGKSFQTPWGNLATTIKVKDGKVIAVEIPELPDSPPSVYAKPYLIDQVLRSGSSNIQGVSGATITSRAFIASIESALAQSASQGAPANAPASFFAGATINTPAPSETTMYSSGGNVPLRVAPATPGATVGAGVSGTFTGNASQTPWGNAVASVTFTNGKITGVTMPQVPDSPPSLYAKPYLIDQTLRAGSSNIQGVSGATITSNAFMTSLESALAQASSRGTVAPTSLVSTRVPSVPAPMQSPTANIPAPAIIKPTASGATVSAGVSGTFTGNAYQTPWGNAVASVTFTNGKITGVTMPQVPSSPPSIQAQSSLVQQALSAGNANIQGVSGATYVSIAFKSSLESAIAKASAQGTVATPAQSQSTTILPSAPTASPLIQRTYRDHDDDNEREENGWDNEWDD